MSDDKDNRRSTGPSSIRDVVAHGLCIGCGLCESITSGRVAMTMTAFGALRPQTVDQFTHEEEGLLMRACPGAVVSAPPRDAPNRDAVWGDYFEMRYAWAGDERVRFESATGGVLTALAQHLLKRGWVDFVLHVAPDASEPLRNRAVISESPEQVSAASRSRYAPTSPLTRLHEALDRQQPFAFVGKPCDVSAITAMAALDDRVDRFCRYRLALVCGGQSRLTKTLGLLERFNADVQNVRRVEYRGFGNPGPTTVTMTDEVVHRTTYNELWAEESSWDLESRCALCADALGEAADVAAADVWPGGAPSGEDEGFNGVVVRSEAGRALMSAAVEHGDLVIGKELSPEAFNDVQPHQWRKKRALQARFDTLNACGKPAPRTAGLRVALLGARLDDDQRARIEAGTRRRVDSGRFTETPEGDAFSKPSPHD